MLHILGICKKNVNKNQKAIECIQCNQWIHIKCNGTSLEDYNIMLETNNILSEEEIADLTWPLALKIPMIYKTSSNQTQ